MRRTAPRPFGFFMAAAGFGIALWYGYDVLRRPVWTEADLARKVEIGIAADLQSRAGPLPDENELDALRKQVHSQLVARLESQKKQDTTAALMGLAVGVFGLAQMVLLRRRG